MEESRNRLRRYFYLTLLDAVRQKREWIRGACVFCLKKRGFHTWVTMRNLCFFGRFYLSQTRNILRSRERSKNFVELIPEDYTCVLQPCDVVLIRSLKAGVRHYCTQRAAQMLAEVPSNHQVPTQARNDVSLWVPDVFKNVLSMFIMETFSHFGLSRMQPTILTLLSHPLPFHFWMIQTPTVS